MLDAALPSGLPGMRALARRELVRFTRQPSRVIAAVGTPLLLWIFLGSGFAGSFGGVGSYAGHLLPGMVMLTVVFSSVFAAISLIDDRNAGFLQGVLASPLPRWALVGSKLIGGGTVAVAQGAILIPGAYLLGMSPSPLGLLMSLVAACAAATMVMGLSLALAWRVNSVQGFHGVMNLVLMPMWLLSGAFFPVSGASFWLKIVMLANPLTWATEAMRSAITGEASQFAPAWILWAAVALLAVLGACVAGLTVGRGPSHE
ncbi:MAG: ABC transporter permease [Phycisphaerales bacterium]|nr:ABC transporter permease [Phycisphaerales bacterium]